MNISSPALSFWSEVLLAESQRCVTMRNSGNLPMADQIVHQFSLAEYRAAITAYGKDALINHALLQQVLANLEEESERFTALLPPGAMVLLALLPTNTNGSVYTAADIDAGQALRVLVVDPQSRCTLAGHTLPALLPQELWAHCSFQVQYQPFVEAIVDTDFQKVKAQLQAAWQNLCQLLQV